MWLNVPLLLLLASSVQSKFTAAVYKKNAKSATKSAMPTVELELSTVPQHVHPYVVYTSQLGNQKKKVAQKVCEVLGIQLQEAFRNKSFSFFCPESGVRPKTMYLKGVPMNVLSMNGIRIHSPDNNTNKLMDKIVAYNGGANLRFAKEDTWLSDKRRYMELESVVHKVDRQMHFQDENDIKHGLSVVQEDMCSDVERVVDKVSLGVGPLLNCFISAVNKVPKDIKFLDEDAVNITLHLRLSPSGGEVKVKDMLWYLTHEESSSTMYHFGQPIYVTLLKTSGSNNVAYSLQLLSTLFTLQFVAQQLV